MRVVISHITPSDIPSAAMCIQDAFDDDPYNHWVFDTSRFNKERNLASLQAKCEWGIRNALFFVAKDNSSSDPDEVLGVSMWMPPAPASSVQSWAAWLDEWVLYGKQSVNLLWYRGRGGLRLHRYQIWKERQAEAQKEIWTDRRGYYFCNIVVVKPSLQGQGVGRKLFEVVMNKADAEGKRCYLESSRDIPNVGIYQKMGFRVVRKITCEADGERCDLFCMLREPQAEGRTGSND